MDIGPLDLKASHQFPQLWTGIWRIKKEVLSERPIFAHPVPTPHLTAVLERSDLRDVRRVYRGDVIMRSSWLDILTLLAQFA